MKPNRNVYQKDGKSLGQFGGSDMDKNTVIYPTIKEDQV